MKKQYSINIEESVQELGAKLAKKEGKETNTYVSFSKYIENLIRKQTK